MQQFTGSRWRGSAASAWWQHRSAPGGVGFHLIKTVRQPFSRLLLLLLLNCHPAALERAALRTEPWHTGP